MSPRCTCVSGFLKLSLLMFPPSPLSLSLLQPVEAQYPACRSPLQPVVRGCLLQYRRYEVLQLGAAKGGWKFVLLARLSPLPGFVVNFALWQVRSPNSPAPRNPLPPLADVIRPARNSGKWAKPSAVMAGTLSRSL